MAGPSVVTLLALSDVERVLPALLYVLAVAVASTAGGVLYGLAAAVLSFVAFNYWFTPPRHDLALSSTEDAVTAVVFLVTALGVGATIVREGRARLAADAARARSERLRRAADALSEAATPEQVLEAVLTESVAAADARAGLIALVSDDGSELEVAAEQGYGEGVTRTWERFRLDADLPLSQAVRTGEPVFLRSREDRDRSFPALRGAGEDSHALVCLPLVVDRRAIGGLVFSFRSDQEFDEDRRSLKLTLARQAAQAIQRARLYETARLGEERVAFLARAGELLSSSLDYEQTLAALAQTAVPRLADWCSVDVLDEGGGIRRLAVAHTDPARASLGWELAGRFPPDPDAETGVPAVLRTGEAQFMPTIPQELLDAAVERNPELAEVLEQLGIRSVVCVPLKAEGRVVGALTLVSADSGRVYTNADLELAVALAGRAGIAIENSLHYREAERRADAARALAYVGEAVVLVDGSACVRYWNPAASLVTGIEEDEALGQPAARVVPAWDEIARRVTAVDAGTGELARSTTVPASIRGSERWLSVAAVDFGDGVVYALRDVTDEQALERARSDFVATASHELRTPLAAVYGAVRTLRRTDVQLSDEDAELLLEIIERETERLTSIVGQILLAGQVEGERLRVAEDVVDAHALAAEVVASARVRAPDSVSIELSAPDDLPLLRSDEGKLRQVLVNLVENGVKYSPQGGHVRVELTAANGRVRLGVRDSGLGIPESEHERIFEKFYRLDPGLARGVGGTGLGLYIARELVTRLGGRILVESVEGGGSTFTVELPLAATS